MIFEFIIVHRAQDDESVLGIVRQRLRETLESNLNDVEDDVLDGMVRKNFQRPLPVNADGGAREVLGFSLELTEEITYVREVVDEFADALMADPIEHTVKCEDPLLRTELAARADEIFARNEASTCPKCHLPSRVPSMRTHTTYCARKQCSRWGRNRKRNR